MGWLKLRLIFALIFLSVALKSGSTETVGFEKKLAWMKISLAPLVIVTFVEADLGDVNSTVPFPDAVQPLNEYSERTEVERSNWTPTFSSTDPLREGVPPGTPGSDWIVRTTFSALALFAVCCIDPLRSSPLMKLVQAATESAARTRKPRPAKPSRPERCRADARSEAASRWAISFVLVGFMAATTCYFFWASKAENSVWSRARRMT